LTSDLCSLDLANGKRGQVEEADVADNDGDSGQRESLVVDVSGLTLAQLASSTSSALRRSIGYILEDQQRAAESISGWGSYIDKEPDAS
jgi:hypothetical protein